MSAHAVDTRLHGRWLLLARVGWLAVAGLTISLAAAGLTISVQHAELVGPPVVDKALARAGIPGALAVSSILIPLMLAFGGAALVIFWRRSDDWMAMLFALMLLTFGATITRSLYVLELVYPATAIPVHVVWGFGLYLWIPVLFLFPTGRFVPPWTWLLALACLPPLTVLLAPNFGELVHYFPDLPPDGSVWRWWIVLPCIVVPGGVGAFAQIFRYRRVSSPVERQQTKWVVFSFSGAFLIGCFAFGIPSLIWEPDEWYGWMMMATTIPLSFIPITTAMAVLRYRLWDVDPLINRALVYGLLTAGLGLAYWGGMVLFQQLLRSITQGSEVGVIGSTLLVTALFLPARDRIQRFVDRRFYRQKYNAQRTLASFGATVRNEVGLDNLAVRLVDVARETVQPTQAFLWLRATHNQIPESAAGHPRRNVAGTVGE